MRRGPETLSATEMELHEIVGKGASSDADPRIAQKRAELKKLLMEQGHDEARAESLLANSYDNKENTAADRARIEHNIRTPDTIVQMPQEKAKKRKTPSQDQSETKNGSNPNERQKADITHEREDEKPLSPEALPNLEFLSREDFNRISQDPMHAESMRGLLLVKKQELAALAKKKGYTLTGLVKLSERGGLDNVRSVKRTLDSLDHFFTSSAGSPMDEGVLRYRYADYLAFTVQYKELMTDLGVLAEQEKVSGTNRKKGDTTAVKRSVPGRVPNVPASTDIPSSPDEEVNDEPAPGASDSEPLAKDSTDPRMLERSMPSGADEGALGADSSEGKDNSEKQSFIQQYRNKLARADSFFAGEEIPDDKRTEIDPLLVELESLTNDLNEYEQHGARDLGREERMEQRFNAFIEAGKNVANENIETRLPKKEWEKRADLRKRWKSTKEAYGQALNDEENRAVWNKILGIGKMPKEIEEEYLRTRQEYASQLKDAIDARATAREGKEGYTSSPSPDQIKARFFKRYVENESQALMAAQHEALPPEKQLFYQRWTAKFDKLPDAVKFVAATSLGVGVGYGVSVMTGGTWSAARVLLGLGVGLTLGKHASKKAHDKVFSWGDRRVESQKVRVGEVQTEQQRTFDVSDLTSSESLLRGEKNRVVGLEKARERNAKLAGRAAASATGFGAGLGAGYAGVPSFSFTDWFGGGTSNVAEQVTIQDGVNRAGMGTGTDVPATEAIRETAPMHFQETDHYAVRSEEAGAGDTAVEEGTRSDAEEIVPHGEVHVVQKGDTAWRAMAEKSEVLRGMSEVERNKALVELFKYVDENPRFAAAAGFSSGESNLIRYPDGAHPGDKLMIGVMDDHLRQQLGMEASATDTSSVAPAEASVSEPAPDARPEGLDSAPVLETKLDNMHAGDLMGILKRATAGSLTPFDQQRLGALNMSPDTLQGFLNSIGPRLIEQTGGDIPQGMRIADVLNPDIPIGEPGWWYPTAIYEMRFNDIYDLQEAAGRGDVRALRALDSMGLNRQSLDNIVGSLYLLVDNKDIPAEMYVKDFLADVSSRSVGVEANVSTPDPTPVQETRPGVTEATPRLTEADWTGESAVLSKVQNERIGELMEMLKRGQNEGLRVIDQARLRTLGLSGMSDLVRIQEMLLEKGGGEYPLDSTVKEFMESDGEYLNDTTYTNNEPVDDSAQEQQTPQEQRNGDVRIASVDALPRDDAPTFDQIGDVANMRKEIVVDVEGSGSIWDSIVSLGSSEAGTFSKLENITLQQIKDAVGKNGEVRGDFLVDHAITEDGLEVWRDWISEMSEKVPVTNSQMSLREYVNAVAADRVPPQKITT